MTKELVTTESTADPWSDLDRAFREMSARVFEPYALAGFAPTVPSDGGRLRAARTDVADTGAAYRIVAEIPGIPKEKLDIRVRGSTVEIRGEHAEDSAEESSTFLHRERSARGYYRLLELPEAVVGSDATAKVEQGLLELELPKQHPTPSPAEVKVRVA